ncbi:MAG: phage/plasmid primase, P4 family [Candidatus Nanohaloarchaea archaeon]
MARKTVEYIKNKNQVKKEDFKPPKNKIPFENGVYCLEDSEFKDYQPKYNFTFKYNASYRPELDDNSVHEFLTTIQDTEEDIKKLKEITGLCMMPDIPIDKAPILFGKGANGKNQYVKINRKILGEKNWHELNNTDISEDKHATAELEGKQMVFYDEFEDVSSPGKLKHLIGAENMRVRPMRKEGYTITNRAYPIFAANTLPRTSDQSKGFFRRWEIIEFPFQFTKDDDHHKDLIPESELEDRYMNQDALDAYATEAVQHLENVLEDSKLTNEQNTAEVKHRWNQKANPIYSFIDNFLEQGELPDHDGTGEVDYITKDNLTEIINVYMDALNTSHVQKHEVTHALQNHADLKVQTDYRPQLETGERPTAYAGINFTSDCDTDVKGKPLVTTRASARLRDFSMRRSTLVIGVKENLVSVYNYLDSVADGAAGLFELVRECELSESDVRDLMESDFFVASGDSVDGFCCPRFEIDEDAVATALEESDAETLRVDGDEQLMRPRDWIRVEIEDWSNDTYVDVQELVDDAVDEGFGESAVEDALDRLVDDGVLYRPEPGKVSKL